MSNQTCLKCGGEVVGGFCEDCGAPVASATVSLIPATATGNIPTTYTSTFATGTFGTSALGKPTTKRTARTSGGTTSQRRKLGGNLVLIAPQPTIDPLTMVMAKAEVPQHKRTCSNDCRDKDGAIIKFAKEKGFCPKCGKAYNFIASLKADDVVAKKYKVAGAIAFGGLGWIYLAKDIMLNRWVVLKGLLNAKDEAAAEAAVAERQFLAAIKHPKIVGIYDFVQHGNEGFIVMEYVGGKMISALYKDTPSKVLPVTEAIAYILGILPAFTYLHSQGFIYCDFKADNFMLEGDDVKLIDVGGMCVKDDLNGNIYGTRGYMAPEADSNPIEVSDIYTIGRTLAIMTMEFKFQTTYLNSLPSPSEQPVLAGNDSFYRFLLKATHPDPDQRFQTADEMQDQLYGVLRETVSMNTKTAHPMDSATFTQDNALDSDDFTMPSIVQLPALKMTLTDPAASDLAAAAMITDINKRIVVLQDIKAKRGIKSPEAALRLADALILAGKHTEARKVIDTLHTTDPFDWRASWYLGKSFLAQNMSDDAKTEFGKCYFEMAGEIAPKLAIAYALEQEGRLAEAISFYTRVATVDPNNTSACIGLARCHHKQDDNAAVSAALNSVPQTHMLYTRSRIILANTLMAAKDVTAPIVDEIANVLGEIATDHAAINKLSARFCELVVGKIKAGVIKQNQSTMLMGTPVTHKHIATASEKFYRLAAKHANTTEERITLVDCANAVRPSTMV